MGVQGITSRSEANLRVWAFRRFVTMENPEPHVMKGHEFIDPYREEEVKEHRRRVVAYFRAHPGAKRGKGASHITPIEIYTRRRAGVLALMRMVEELPEVWAATQTGGLPYRKTNAEEIFARALWSSMRPLKPGGHKLWLQHCKVNSVRRRNDSTRREK